MQNLFQVKNDIPEKHLQLMLVCNSNKFLYQQAFYKLKHKILSKHGKVDGYDLQIVKRKCNACNGTGIYDKADNIECNRCNSGIYSTSQYILKRYFSNGCSFLR